MKKTVVLLSGGLDSTTCLAIAQQECDEVYALSFDYGQKHWSELTAAVTIAKMFAVKAHETVKLCLDNLTRSALVNQNITVPDYTGEGGIPSTYVPARNTLFLSIGLGWAEVLNAESLYIGVSAVDYSGYPDCRPEYIEAYQAMADLATKNSVNGKPITIRSPLIHLTKAETIQLGHQLGVDYALTISCYRASGQGYSCGRCDSCELRRRGFEQAGVPDPTQYID